MKALIGLAFLAFGFTAQALPARPSQYHLAFSTIHAHAKFTEGPFVGKNSSLRLEFKNSSDHKPQEPNATVFVELKMPEHNHGSSETVVSEMRGDGVYEVSNVYFIMDGKWDVNVYLTEPDGTVKEMQTFSLELGPMDHPLH